MSKQKKKRNKRYRGADAATSRPTITRVQAVNRNRVSQWWFDHKKIARPLLIAGGVITALGVMLFEIFRIVFGG